MAIKLSHSQISKYQMCGHSYKLHYLDKIRSTVQSAALVFGSALDRALNELLRPEGKKSPQDIFDYNFRFTDVNGEKVYIPLSTKMVYANADFDMDLLQEEDFAELDKLVLNHQLQVNENYEKDLLSLKKKKTSSGFDSFTEPEKKLYNFMNWLSLRRKGHLMIIAYAQQVMPLIEKVHDIQKYIELKNTDGDKIIGYVDIIADVKGFGTVILDNKTSAMEYEKDSVLTSSQLTLYTHIIGPKYNTRKAGFIVLRKNVIKNRTKECKLCGKDGSGQRHKTCDAMIDKKRCNGEWLETIDPKIDIQILIDEIPEQTEDIVLENLDAINYGIKQGVFHRNFQTCTNHYGGNCPYLNLCFKNKMDGLVDMKEKK